MLRMVHALEQILPLIPVDVVERQTELTHDIGVEPLVE